jgi:hypothetical protein
MRKFKYGLVALVASAAIAVPATGAIASTQSAATLPLAGECNGILNCFTLIDGDVVVKDNANITDTIDFCGNIGIVQALLVGQVADCGNGKKVHRKK